MTALRTARRAMVLAHLLMLIGSFGVSGVALAGAETFFGIKMGAPFEVPQCTTSSNDQPNDPNVELCYSRYDDVHYDWGYIDHSVSHKTNWAGMSWDPIPHGRITVTTLNQKVVKIAVGTKGLSAQDDVLSDLVRKYGKPGKFRMNALQNAFGARIPSVEAVWQRPGYKVRFDGVVSSVDFGYLLLTTPEGDREPLVKEQWLKRNKQSPTM